MGHANQLWWDVWCTFALSVFWSVPKCFVSYFFYIGIYITHYAWCMLEITTQTDTGLYEAPKTCVEKFCTVYRLKLPQPRLWSAPWCSLNFKTDPSSKTNWIWYDVLVPQNARDRQVQAALCHSEVSNLHLIQADRAHMPKQAWKTASSCLCFTGNTQFQDQSMLPVRCPDKAISDWNVCSGVSQSQHSGVTLQRPLCAQQPCVLVSSPK